MPEIISMVGQVGVGYRVRALEDIDGIGVHYFAVDLQDFFDYPIVPEELTQEEEESVILIVDEYHDSPPQRDWGGIGYHFVPFPSGRVYSMGSLRCQRAGVANHNRHLVHIAFPTAGIPSKGSRESARWVIEHMISRDLVVKGHRQWADASHPTDCPGVEWESWLPAMIAEEGDMATEWERYTKGLVHDMSYFSAVKRAAQGVEERAVLLPAVWRRSDVDPPLDHVTVYEGLSAWCDVLIEAAEALKKRATDRGF